MCLHVSWLSVDQFFDTKKNLNNTVTVFKLVASALVRGNIIYVTSVMRHPAAPGMGILPKRPRPSSKPFPRGATIDFEAVHVFHSVHELKRIMKDVAFYDPEVHHGYFVYVIEIPKEDILAVGEMGDLALKKLVLPDNDPIDYIDFLKSY